MAPSSFRWQLTARAATSGAMSDISIFRLLRLSFISNRMAVQNLGTESSTS